MAHAVPSFPASLILCVFPFPQCLCLFLCLCVCVCVHVCVCVLFFRSVPCRVRRLSSSLATHSIEEVAAACARHDPAEAAPRWFQLYVFRDRSIAADLVQRAADAGFDAICVTVDAPVFGKREEDLRSGMHLPLGLSLENFRKYIVPRSEVSGACIAASVWMWLVMHLCVCVFPH